MYVSEDGRSQRGDMNTLRRMREWGYSGHLEYTHSLNSLLYDSLARVESPDFAKIHVGAINSLSVEKVEERYLLSGGGDSSIKLWDLDSTVVEQSTGESKIECIGQIPRKEGHKYGVSHVQWWPFDNGLFVSSSFDNTVKIWEPNSLAEAYSFNLGAKVYNFDISAVGEHSLVATASDQQFIRLLDLRTTSSSHTLTSHSERTLSVKWSPKHANILASAGSDGAVRVWDIRRSNACVASLDMQQVNDNPTRTPMTQRKAHRSSANGLCWFPSGDYLVSSGNDEKIRVWSLHPMGGKNMLINFGPLIRNHHVQTLDPCLSPVRDAEWPYLFFPSDNGEIFMFRAVDGKIVKRLTRENSSRSACIISRGPSHLQFFSGALDGTISTWSPHLQTLDETLDEDTELFGEHGPDVLDEIWKSMNA